ncbi:hypothetical protein [Haliangium sp. UPWRP_2]|uniref:hypothetical protein n=1 Tax=Haliangium sp. UPWRP_2 TaxID=1931276 RepID=UPI000B544426|nr:hypothetical protein [Haliangium sp. UPWRP_2]PSM32374.1 hypothetical protein BVG81_000630 [Haliangium sp. UPWRP_2]HNN97342.1 hypothetical protein [Pseudomonadota bacterium]
MNARAQQAHSAQQALANLRAQNPQLGHKLHLASAQPEQLALLFDQAGAIAATERGTKAHEWDLARPVSKTRLYVTYQCKRCPVQLRRIVRGPTYYGTPAAGRLGSVYVFDNKRPSCPPLKERRHG